jgi:hypothetical protein
MITSSTPFFTQGCGKTRSFMIDVVVPRMDHEVYDLLVIAPDASKSHLVTSFAIELGYFMTIETNVAPELPNRQYGL